MPAGQTRLGIALAGNAVSGLLEEPADPQACYVFAHGAGAGMEHPFMAALATGLAARGIAVLRFQFPYMEQGSKRPDPPKVAQAVVRAAVAEAGRRLAGVPLFAGGKSFGGRMTTQAQAAEPLPGVHGIVLPGFPLHPAGKPGIDRAAHLADVQLPLLFLQGTRDALADIDLMRKVTGSLGTRATLHVIDGADHSFHVLVRSGRNDQQVREELLDTMAAWMMALVRDDSRSA
jgi:predicted alpha/beta-hydrolase family hydrolase